MFTRVLATSEPRGSRAKSSFLLLTPRVLERGKWKQEDAMGTSERSAPQSCHLSLRGLLGPVRPPCGGSHTQLAGRHTSHFWLLISQTPASLPRVSPLPIINSPHSPYSPNIPSRWTLPMVPLSPTRDGHPSQVPLKKVPFLIYFFVPRTYEST